MQNRHEVRRHVNGVRGPATGCVDIGYPYASFIPVQKGFSMASSLFDLTGQVAIVTGSTKGIGKSIAEELGHDIEDIYAQRAREMAMRKTYGLPEAQHQGITGNGDPNAAEPAGDSTDP